MADESEMSCVLDPNFAVICSFLDNFAETCKIDHPPFLELEEMLSNTEEVATPLIELHIQLLQRMNRRHPKDKWENGCIKFCNWNSYSRDGKDLARLGYMKSPLSLKLRLLKNLMEAQFDRNKHFEVIVKKFKAQELRVKPIGRDALDRTYWHLLDNDCNLYVYREDRNNTNWEIVSRDQDELVKLIEDLSPNEGDDVANSGSSTEMASADEVEQTGTDKSEPEFEECMPDFYYEPGESDDGDFDEFEDSFMKSDASVDTDSNEFAGSDKESDSSDE